MGPRGERDNLVSAGLLPAMSVLPRTEPFQSQSLEASFWCPTGTGTNTGCQCHSAGPASFLWQGYSLCSTLPALPQCGLSLQQCEGVCDALLLSWLHHNPPVMFFLFLQYLPDTYRAAHSAMACHTVNICCSDHPYEKQHGLTLKLLSSPKRKSPPVSER